ncbi:TetR family transcriptional regulator C-terminal domain-containing protein [Pontibacter sp. G13]|uniref:TetR/AcrR family transcriptional regulator n=1 Tax=Pontibacter sp. G13 TaxID=3074898 RepID=UPI0028896146|nr:TetR family transcriptional regulator C-terminal domain-containing protein [Pontibacter sp. G13]WNJ16664.1 TetR family transcriptional regulator C-terminal domain-containing protein [Pontibacter sp. G13]
MAKKSISLEEAYYDYVLEQGHRPVSVYQFTKSLGKPETDFYASYGSFVALEQAIFRSYFIETRKALEEDKTFQEYGTRERILAILFTWLETLKQHRSFVKFLATAESSLFDYDRYQTTTKDAFQEFVKDILDEGTDQGEIADRLFIPKWYKDGAWMIAKGMLDFWLKDASEQFQKTDAYIEKTVNFWFDLIQPNALDSGFDLVKFILQR